MVFKSRSVPSFKPPLGARLNSGIALAQNLCGLWLFNEYGGLTLYDTAGYGNGALGGTSGFPSWENAGFSGPDLSFANANTQKVTITNNAQYLNKSFSIAVAFRLDSLRNYNALVTKTNGNAGGPFDMYVDGSGVLQFFVANNVTFSAGANPQISGIAATTWYYAHFTWDNNGGGTGTATAYLNGINKASATTAATNVVNGTKNILFGTRDDAGTILGGKIGLVKIWDRLINAQEVMLDYLNPYAMLNVRHRLTLPASSVVALSINANDAIAIADGSIGAGIYLILPQNFLNAYFAGFREFLTFSDNLSLAAQFFLKASDSLALSDLLTLIVNPGAAVNINDVITLTDAVSTVVNNVAIPINVMISDVLSIVDSINVAGPNGLQITDNLILNDAIVIVLKSTITNYIRRYLNDVQ